MAYNKTVSTADIIIKIHVINTPEFLNIDDRGMFWGKLYTKEKKTVISMGKLRLLFLSAVRAIWFLV